MDNAEMEVLRAHLRAQYAGVFDEKIIEQHIGDYIDTSMGELLMDQLRGHGLSSCRLLDIGCGYGTTVLSLRQQGVDAIGVEFAAFEVEFARKQLKKLRPADDTTHIYQHGDALRLPFPAESFDAVTLINVLEHVPDYRKALAEAIRVLRPGGLLYAICPNYAAFRREAHYLVPWFPLLPKSLAAVYLRLLGRNPAFLRDCVHYCTNWGVLGALARLPVETGNPVLVKLDNLALIGNPRLRAALTLLKNLKLQWLARGAAKFAFYNPFKQAVWLTATKRVRA
jgi:MPBQ/MSBQ methyltransferase